MVFADVVGRGAWRETQSAGQMGNLEFKIVASAHQVVRTSDGLELNRLKGMRGLAAAFFNRSQCCWIGGETVSRVYAV